VSLSNRPNPAAYRPSGVIYMGSTDGNVYALE